MKHGKESARRGLGAKVGKTALAGALVFSLVPAAAVSAFGVTLDEQGKNALGKILANTQWESSDGTTYTIWPDGYWSSRDDENGTYVWTTYVQGDDSHYGYYDVDITFTVNENKELTAVDISSNGTTFGGEWGNISKSTAISGYLPDGVKNETAIDKQADGSVIVTPKLGGDIANYDTSGNGGWTISANEGVEADIVIFKTDEDGNIAYQKDAEGNIVYDETVDEEGGDIIRTPVSDSATISVSKGSSDDSIATYDAGTGQITVKDPSYNLVQTCYKIGSFFRFVQYTALDDNAAKYDVEQTDYDAEVSGIGLKNRDNYTLSVYAIMIQHELAVFMDEETGTLGADVDTISSATKSSWAIQEAVYAALGYSYPVTNKVEYDSSITMTESGYDAIFTSVSGSLKMTMDGETSVWDETAATENEDGAIDVSLEDYDGSLSIGSIALYKIDGELSGTELYDLGSANGATMVDADNDEDVSATGMTAHWVTSTSAGHGVKGALTSDEVTGAATFDADTNTLSVADSTDANYVVVGYSVAKTSTGGYGQVCVAYSIDDLLAAGNVTKLIESIDTSSNLTILQAEDAYDALNTVQKTYVSRSAVSALEEAVDGITSFPDNQDTSKWYYRTVVYADALGLMTGYANGNFGVGDTMKRQDIAVVMWRIGDPEGYEAAQEDCASMGTYSAVNETDMPDVKSHTYYTEAVNWCAENGIMTGYENGKFGVGDKVTFQQFCKLLANYLSDGEADGYDTSGLSAFSDVSSVASWADGAVAWCVDNGLVNGNANATLAPKSNVKRERVATVFVNAVGAGQLVL